MRRFALSFLMLIGLAPPFAVFSKPGHAAGIEVELKCENLVCGRSSYSDGRVWIYLSKEFDAEGYFNFKTNPGAQIEIKNVYSFDRAPGDNGTYSVQWCRPVFGPVARAACGSWLTFNWTSGPAPASGAVAPKPIERTGRAPTPPPISRTGRAPRPSAEETAAREAEAALIVADRQVTGKSPAQCEASRSRCFNQCQARGVGAAEVCQLQECQPIFVQCSANANLNRGDGPATNFVTVIKSVDLYADKFGEGGKKGVLRAGARGVVLVEPCADDWCRVESRSGSGWVYNGDDYRSLDIP